MSRHASFSFDTGTYHVLFTPGHESYRLSPTGEMESVTTVKCEIYDDALALPVASGLAICSEDDDFNPEKGMRLALARALDDAEDALPGWDDLLSNQLLVTLISAVPECRAMGKGVDVRAADCATSHAAYTKAILPAVNAHPARDAQNDSGGITNPSAPLHLNNYFRKQAARLGIGIAEPVGSLTMKELSQLYHALLKEMR